MLADAARGEKRSRSGGSRVSLLDVDTGRLVGLKNMLVCYFELAVDLIGDDIREFVIDMDGPAFLERELMGLGVDKYQQVRGHDCTSRPLPMYVSRASDLFFQFIKHYILYI